MCVMDLVPLGTDCLSRSETKMWDAGGEFYKRKCIVRRSVKKMQQLFHHVFTPLCWFYGFLCAPVLVLPFMYMYFWRTSVYNSVIMTSRFPFFLVVWVDLFPAQSYLNALYMLRKSRFTQFYKDNSCHSASTAATAAETLSGPPDSQIKLLCFLESQEEGPRGVHLVIFVIHCLCHAWQAALHKTKDVTNRISRLEQKALLWGGGQSHVHVKQAQSWKVLFFFQFPCTLAYWFSNFKVAF